MPATFKAKGGSNQSIRSVGGIQRRELCPEKMHAYQIPPALLLTAMRVRLNENLLAGEQIACRLACSSRMQQATTDVPQHLLQSEDRGEQKYAEEILNDITTARTSLAQQLPRKS